MIGSGVTLSLPQSIATTSTPTFGGLTLTGLSGMLKATAGVISGSQLPQIFQKELTFTSQMPELEVQFLPPPQD